MAHTLSKHGLLSDNTEEVLGATKTQKMWAIRDWVRGSKPKRQEEIDRGRRRKPSGNKTSLREADGVDQDKDREEERHKPQVHREQA